MPHKPKKELLKGTTGVVYSKVIGCNTLEIKYQNGNRAIRYHNTDVITTLPNGDVVLTSGGYRTYTTKVRLNQQFNVWSEKSIWYIKEPATNKILAFYDGITFNSTGKLKGKAKKVNTKHINAVKRKIAKYVKLLDSLNQIPLPNSGDCWCCSMKTTEGKALGDQTNDTSHLESHLEEGYLHGSIIYNALVERGYQNPALIMSMNCTTSIKAALRRYLTKRLLPEVQAA